MKNNDRQMNNNDKQKPNPYHIISSEYIFIFLPVIIILIILIYKNQSKLILSSPEWSMIACILFGQLILKIVNATSVTRLAPDRITSAVTILVCFGLIPSLVILTLVFISQEQPILWITITQLFLFIISSITFIIFGSAFEDIKNESKTN